MIKRTQLLEIYANNSTPQELFFDTLEQIEKLEGGIADLLKYINKHIKTDEDLRKIIKPLIPKVKNGDDGKTPSEDDLIRLIKRLIPKPIAGKDGSIISPFEIRNKIKSLKGDDRLSIFALKDIEWLKGKDGKMQWSSAGFKVYTDGVTITGDGSANNPLVAQTSSGGFTELPAVGAVNGSNVSFTFSKVPSYIVSDGAWYKKLDNNGGVQWSSSGTTVTMVIPPQSSIFGIA